MVASAADKLRLQPERACTRRKSDGNRRTVSFGKVRDGKEFPPFDINFDFQSDSVILSSVGATDRPARPEPLEDRIWRLVRSYPAGPSGERCRCPVTVVKEKFMPGRKGKTQFYAAVKELLGRTRARTRG